MEGLYRPFWSPWIIGELYRVLTWIWAKDHGCTAESQRTCSRASKTMMQLMVPVFTVVDPKPPWDTDAWPSLASQDPDDYPLWAAARTARAVFVVSNNTGDFPPIEAEGRHMWNGVEYVKPAVFFANIGYAGLR